MNLGELTTEVSKEREIKAILKAKRASIRLKYSLAADQEIATEIPLLEKKLLAALEAGELVTLQIGVES